MDLGLGIISGKPLADQHTLGAALPRLADGREMVLQVIPAAETISSNDMSIRVSYFGGAKSKRLFPVGDLIVHRRMKVCQFYHCLLPETRRPRLIGFPGFVCIFSFPSFRRF